MPTACAGALTLLCGVLAPAFASGPAPPSPPPRLSPPPPAQERPQTHRPQQQRQQEPQQGQPQTLEIWPVDWFSDLPAVDLSGTWVFDPSQSDPMLPEWSEHEVRYEIRQESARIILDFRVGEAGINTQTYRWDGTIQRFERGDRQVQEAARWTDAGNTLEVAGRHWSALAQDERVHYRFAYSRRGHVLTFVQENDAGRTRWAFVRERAAQPGPRQRLGRADGGAAGG